MRAIFVVVALASLMCMEKAMSQDKPFYSIAHVDTILLRNAKSVVRREETRYTIQTPRVWSYTVSRAVTILDNDAADIWVRVAYDKYSKIDQLDITLYDAAGTFIRKIKKSELGDYAMVDGITIFSDNRWTGIRALAGKLPYTIETTYKVSLSQTMYYDPWLPASVDESVESASFILEAPAGMTFHTKALNYPFSYQGDTTGAMQVHRWSMERFPARKKEINGPPWHAIDPVVLVSPAVFQVGEFTGSMSDWKSFGKFIYDINKGKEEMPPVMQATIRRMVANMNSPREKIDTLYRWLQANMRYVSVQLGIGGWQSFDAGYVEENRFGDCKALSTFMKGMLHEAGIKAQTFLIEAAAAPNLFLDDFVFPDFNHMMVYVPGEDLWLECTSSHMQAGQLYDVEENKKVLLITPEGGVITHTPFSLPGDNTMQHTDTITLGDEPGLRGATRYTGTTQHSPVYISNRSLEEQRTWLLEGLPFAVKKLHHLKFSRDDESRSATFSYAASLLNFGSKAGDRIFIPTRAFLRDEWHCTGHQERNSSLYFHDNFVKDHTCYVKIPAGYTVELLPASQELQFGEQHFSLLFAADETHIRLEYILSKRPMQVDATGFGKWCDFEKDIAQVLNQQVVLKLVRP